MELNFQIDKELLFSYAVWGKNADKITYFDNVRNDLWSKYKDAYELFLYKEINLFFTEANFLEKFSQMPQQLKEIFAEGMSSPEFEKLVTETIEYMTWVENEWTSKRDVVLKELKDIIRVEIPSKIYSVNVVHPKFGEGLSTQKGIIWGHTEDWENYSIVYLAHEFLHSMFGRSEIEHSIIELVADNELRIRLNGHGEYFYLNNETVGHEFLLETEKGLFDEWQSYLKNSDQNIHQFLEQVKKG